MNPLQRLNRLRAKLQASSLAAILISQEDNRRYLSGFTGSDGYLLITAKRQIIATDFRYVEQVKREAPEYSLFQIARDMAIWFPQLVEGLGLKELAFEAEAVSFDLYSRLKAVTDSLGINLKPTSGFVPELRSVKEPAEVDLIKQAIALSDAAVAHAAKILKPGLTELHLAWEIEKHMREHGSENLPFEVIVAAGPNAALPHARPSPRPIRAGEPIVIDIGARVGGYASDLTRTLCLGEPTAEFQKVYGIVLKAQLAAEAGITAGMTGGAADTLAREVIAEAGYGAQFGHGLGHGVGLATHEGPRVGAASKDVLENNMVFTVEPGIYLPGWGGVRIEDIVIMENGKISVLSQAEK
jgi:Xaa-Pro aminopeptidase